MRTGGFKNLAEANRANLLYVQAEEAWRGNDVRSAFRLFLASAKAGMVPAFGIVGQFYARGEGVAKNDRAALNWYQRAADNGDDSAANNAGCIWRDRGNLARALQWFERAAKLGDPDANLEIAKVYLRKKDPARARPYLVRVRKSAWATEQSKEEAQALVNAMAQPQSRRRSVPVEP
ncbi:MAG: tetratricopeptide repeat protein [Acetobacteraceae bacterium]